LPAALCLGRESYRERTPLLTLVREGPPHAAGPGGTPELRLLDQVRAAIHLRHYSRRTEKAYTSWIRSRFILFNGKQHPLEMGKAEVSRFLSQLAVEAKVSASTQNQALSAQHFLYGEVLNQDLGWLDETVRAKRPTRLPVALNRVTLLPATVAVPLAEHLGRVRAQHEQDLHRGLGSVELPLALERKSPRDETLADHAGRTTYRLDPRWLRIT